jgi:hypothetical protein
MSRANPRYHRINPSLPLVGSGNGVVQYRIIGVIENQMTMNTFYYSAAVPAPTTTQLNTLLTNIQAGMFPLYKLCLSADWKCSSEALNVVHRNDILGVQSAANLNVAGGRAAGHMPTEVAQPIIRYTATKGQHGRGRFSLPAISTADVTASAITAAAAVTAIANFSTECLATFSDGANTWTPCLAQRSTASPKLVIGFAPLTKLIFSPNLGTIRKRKIGRGR